MAFNRNIITVDDIENLTDSNKASPKALAANPPAATPPKAPTADDYITKVLKYVPVEVVGFYLFVSTLIVQNEPAKSTSLSGWLLVLWIASVAATCLYDRIVLMIQRTQQIVMSAIGLTVYISALGGWFGTTTWYHIWYGTIALAVFSLAVAMLKVPALPTDQS